jgi:hypothetical protein
VEREREGRDTIDTDFNPRCLLLLLHLDHQNSLTVIPLASFPSSSQCATPRALGFTHLPKVWVKIGGNFISVNQVLYTSSVHTSSVLEDAVYGNLENIIK